MKYIIYVCLVVIAVIQPNSGYSFTVGEESLLKTVGREADGIVFRLWPDDSSAPTGGRDTSAETVEQSRSGKPGIRNVDKPSVVVIPPPKGITPTGTTMLFAPGGGYGSLSLPNAVDIYKWANAIGAHCAVLKYRVPRDPDDPDRLIPLSDAQRAVRLLRSKASELKVDPNKIILIGSSAGGHLGFNLANNHGQSTYQPIDPADDESARPDAVVLLYPAYLTKPTASRNADPQLNLSKLNPQRTPPIFMTVTRPDKFIWGAVNTMIELRKAKVPAELHVFSEGGHGGCFDKYPLMEFVRPAARFLKDRGVFTAAMQRESNAFLDQLESDHLVRPTKIDPMTRTTETAYPSDWTDGDRKLAALRDSPPEVVSIWPGNGRREDDPDADLQEQLPDKGDGKVRVTSVSRPTMHVWQPERSDGRAVIIFPGGAYNGLAAQHEGTEIASWLNTQGITAFVVKYRVPRRQGMQKYAVALQDAQRAIRIVRSRANDFGIDPNQIGVLGFSAGGNLAALTIHHAAQSSYDFVDNVDEANAKPNFAVLVYPAYLAKDDKDVELDALLRTLPSRNEYPPVYMAVAADDRFAPGSLLYLLHLHQANVPGELHVYENGGHGKGLRETGGPFAQWTRSCQRWLNDLKYGTEQVVIE